MNQLFGWTNIQQQQQKVFNNLFFLSNEFNTETQLQHSVNPQGVRFANSNFLTHTVIQSINPSEIVNRDREKVSISIVLLVFNPKLHEIVHSFRIQSFNEQFVLIYSGNIEKKRHEILSIYTTTKSKIRVFILANWK